MRILFITELYPIASKGGEFIRNYGLCKMLESSGHDIVAILGNKFPNFSIEKADRDNYILHDFTNHYSTNQLKDALLKFRRQPDLLKVIKDVLSDRKPDVVFIDYYYFGQYIDYFRKKGIPVIYGTHNVQSRINLQNPVRTIRNKISRYITYLLFRFHELYYFRKSAAVLAVSDEDLKFYRKWFSSKKLYTIPNFLIEDDYKVKAIEKENYIIMTGNFNAFQNENGLKWFLENIWDDDLAEMTKFIIAGRGSDRVYNEICDGRSFKSVKALGEVEDMKPHLAKAKAAIVPLLHGSGTRLKCIESMALRTQLISTSLGAEGIDHKGSIIIADDPETFKKSISTIIKDETDYTEEAYNIFISQYSLKGNRDTFNTIVEKITIDNQP